MLFKIIIIPLLLISLALSAYVFLINANQIADTKIITPFSAGQVLLSERVSYLFISPQVGDRVIFRPDEKNSHVDYVGVVTKINYKENGDIQYFVASKNINKPFILTKRGILRKIYYPLMSNSEVLSLLPEPEPKVTSPIRNPANCWKYTTAETCSPTGVPPDPCAWYLCSNSCHPRGTSNCAAGCAEYCNSPTPTPLFANCAPFKIGLNRSNGALFLTDINKRGYEGIVRKSSSGTATSFDLITNMLPDSAGPYYLWIINQDKNGQICTETNLGSLYKDPKLGVWEASFDDNNYNDDASYVVVTGSGFGKSSSDRIMSLNNPNILLSGSFSQSNSTTGY